MPGTNDFYLLYVDCENENINITEDTFGIWDWKPNFLELQPSPLVSYQE